MADIILVDDDPQVRAVLKGFLLIGNHTVREAENGRNALKLLKTERPDLIITDIVMPESDGFELIMSLSKSLNPPKIIAISGGSSNLNQQMLLGIAQRMPVSTVLSKPVSCEALLAAVADALKSPHNLT